MKTFCLVLLLLLLSVIAQGICSEEESSATPLSKSAQMKREERPPTTFSKGSPINQGAVNFLGMGGRKLLTKETMKASQTVKIPGKGNYNIGAVTKQGVKEETYTDVLDLTRMDYSSANRKPPIHN